MKNFKGSQLQFYKAYSYAIDLVGKDNPGGYSFPCDQYGNILEAEMKPTNWQSFYCVFEQIYSGKWKTPYIREYSWTYLEPAEGDCECGDHIILHSAMTNECLKCGRLYNGGGQLLAPRLQWEEDGEYEPGLFTDDDIEMMGGY